MLIQLLVELNTALKTEGIKRAPEQLAMAARYILQAEDLFPDEDLASSLKPILISRIEEEEAYWKAWQRLANPPDPSQQQMVLYQLLNQKASIKEFTPQAWERSRQQGLQWAPWQAYQKYRQGKMTQDEWQHSTMAALAQQQDLQKWEKAIDQELAQRFKEGKPAEELLEQAMAFRREFFRLRRQWNSVMKTIPSTPLNTAPKIGEKKSLRPTFEEGMRPNIQRWGDPSLFMQSMENISEAQLLQLQEPIRRMAERLKVRLQKMHRRGRRQINLKKTLQYSIKTFGEPLKIIYQRPKRKPARWVVLADVSGSVKHASRLFMSFLFEVKNVVDEDIETFVFVSQVEPVNEILQQPSYEQMVECLYHQGAVDFRGYSDYGKAFQEFEQLAESLLDQQTVLLIIGDARNNRRNPRLDLLQKWALQTRKLLWFNPDLPDKWDKGDSIIGIYQQAIHQLYDVSTPAKLVAAIESVVL